MDESVCKGCSRGERLHRGAQRLNIGLDGLVVQTQCLAGIGVDAGLAVVKGLHPVSYTHLTRMDYAKVTARLSYFAEGLAKLFGKAELPPPDEEE